MNMNPIRQKLDKMFGRSKKTNKTNAISKFQSPQKMSTMPQSNDFSGLSSIKENLSFCIENENFNQAQLQITALKIQLTEYKKKTKKLSSKLKDHEMLQQFYLQQLKQREEIQKQLKWKLEVIREELNKQSDRSNTRLTELSRQSSSYFNENRHEVRRVLSYDY